MKIAFISGSCQTLGIQYISSLLKKNGHQVKLFFDPQLFNDSFLSIKLLSNIFDHKKNIVSQLKDYDPDLIGISVITDFYQWASQLSQMIKEEMAVPIILGGIHPTSVPERVIKNPFIDMICLGEGEYPMLELVNSMQIGKIDYSIKNIWFKKDSEIIRNEVRALIEDIDSIPLADKALYYEDSPDFIKDHPYLIATDRGCPNSCSYCCHSFLKPFYKDKGKYFRQRSVDNVIKELQTSKEKYNIKHIEFVDDSFGHDIEWLKYFANEYKKHIGIKFICNMSPTDINKTSIECLKLANCAVIGMGLQSWDKSIRERVFNRKISNEIMEKAISLIKKAGIALSVDNIVGLPDQNNDDLIDSIRFYSKIRPDRIYFFKLQYYPNTQITKKAKESGLFSKEIYEDLLDGKCSDVFRMKSLISKEKELNKDVIRINILLFLMDFLSGKTIENIINKKSYKYFPTIFDPYFIFVIRRMMSSDAEAKLYRKSTLKRYSYFIKLKLLNIFK